jgi:hypothetical protein
MVFGWKGSNYSTQILEGAGNWLVQAHIHKPKDTRISIVGQRVPVASRWHWVGTRCKSPP